MGGESESGGRKDLGRMETRGGEMDGRMDRRKRRMNEWGPRPWGSVTPTALPGRNHFHVKDEEATRCGGSCLQFQPSGG